MKVLFIIAGIVVLLIAAFLNEIRKAPYFDEETNRFIPKEEEEAYLKRTKEKHEELMKNLKRK